MVFCIEGFPNMISGLRFEWASQNPEQSKILRGQYLKKQKKESQIAYRSVLFVF